MAAETGLATAGFVASTVGFLVTIERAAFRANGGRAASPQPSACRKFVHHFIRLYAAFQSYLCRYRKLFMLTGELARQRRLAFLPHASLARISVVRMARAGGLIQRCRA